MRVVLLFFLFVGCAVAQNPYANPAFFDCLPYQTFDLTLLAQPYTIEISQGSACIFVKNVDFEVTFASGVWRQTVFTTKLSSAGALEADSTLCYMDAYAENNLNYDHGVGFYISTSDRYAENETVLVKLTCLLTDWGKNDPDNKCVASFEGYTLFEPTVSTAESIVCGQQRTLKVEDGSISFWDLSQSLQLILFAGAALGGVLFLGLLVLTCLYCSLRCSKGGRGERQPLLEATTQA